MLNRRELLKLSGAMSLTSLVPGFVKAAPASSNGSFRFCLNTSTISGQKPGLVHAIDIASNAGYDGVELWVSDIRKYLDEGGTVNRLAALLKRKKLKVENAISFTEWMVDDTERRSKALEVLEQEMKIMAGLGCHRIAAPPAGVESGKILDIAKAGAYYREIIGLGRKYEVFPLLEFWGASGSLYQFGQAMEIAAAANDSDARILPDVYHMFRGGSGFGWLKLVNGKLIDIIHFNDYPAGKPVNEQTDADRVYPGDGSAPLIEVLKDLHAMGGTKVLSLELFNKTYWSQDAQHVASTGLKKMKALVERAGY